MARAPINYMLDIRSPVDRAMQGYQFGLSEVQAEREEERAQERFGMDRERFGMEQERFGMEKDRFRAQQAQAAQRAASQRAAAARQQAFYGDFSRVVNGEISRKDLLAAYPDFASTMKQTFDLIPDTVAESRVNLGQRVQVALNNGRSDIADNLLATEAEAAANSGNENYARQMNTMREQLEANPRLVFEEIGLQIDAFGSDSQEWRGDDGVVSGASPIGKIAEDVRAGLIPQSVLDAQIRVEERTGDDGLTLQQRVSEEARLRGEYSKRTEDLSSAERNFNVIQTSAQDNSGAGDIALVTSFMKMLDPGSVVRETEFATAANAGGLLARLTTIADKVESGQFLTPGQRTDFQRLASKYLEAAQTQERGVRDSYEAIVENYGLNPVNVFGPDAAAEVPPADAGANIPQSFSTNPSVVSSAEKYGISPQAIWGQMTPEQRSAYE